MTNQNSYTRPVSQLLTHGPVTAKAKATGEWFDYVGHYGLNEEHVPALIRVVQCQDLSKRVPIHAYAPIHACRALGQLGDAGADLYLVRLIDDQLARAELVENILVTLSMFGPSSLRCLERQFEYSAHEYETQIALAAGFCIFAQQQPDYREQCVACLMRALANYSQQHSMLNGVLIYNLIELQAVEAAEVIEQAFQASAVEEGVCGFWSDVQIQLGLAKASDFPPDALMYAGELYPLPSDETSVADAELVE